MPPKSELAPQRRRGSMLENALLDAAWEELCDHGYEGFTIDGVAVRAGTSRAVLYRRWPGKPELAHAALLHTVSKDPVVVPDTGSLRGDVIALMQSANEKRDRLAVLMFTRLGGLYRDTGTTVSDLSAFVQGGRGATMAEIIEHAIARGEIERNQISDRVAELPITLLRHDILMTLQSVSNDDIEEIVDTIFLPLVRLNASRD